jgi:two-component system, LytTR family, response regulator
MNIRAVMVEDEATARDVLRSYLARYCPDVTLAGEAHDAKSGIALIREVRPDLVFLDVEMPYGNAFDVLEGCSGLHFETIFVTAFSEYSLRALNQSAAYYLLKPVAIEDLVKAVGKVQTLLQRQEQFSRNELVLRNFKEPLDEHRQLILPTAEGFEVVAAADITRLRGNGNFTDVHLKDGSKRMICRFLKHFEDILSHPFVRVHKSHIINLRCVRSYHRGSGGYVTLSDGSEVEISPQRKDEFLRAMKVTEGAGY